MERLIEYILGQPRRLICPVGGGSGKSFLSHAGSRNLPDDETLARRMAFQAEEYGHDFLFATMLDVHVSRCLGLRTFFLADGSEHTVANQVRCAADLSKLSVSQALANPLTGAFVRCVRLGQRLANKPVGGACFGPFTVAGAVLGTQNLCLSCLESPASLHQVLEVTTRFVLEMAKACERNGADFFWIAEPTAVLVSAEHFRAFSGQYLQAIFQDIGVAGFLHVPGDTSHLIEEFVHTRAQCLSLDHHLDMRKLAHTIPSHVSMLGNIDSLSLLYEEPAQIVSQVHRLNHAVRNFPNIIIGSGGGLAANTPDANIKALFSAARQASFFSRDDFEKIDTLWRAMACDSFDNIMALLESGRFPGWIVRNSFEEACYYWGKTKQPRLQGQVGSQQVQTLQKVLESPFFEAETTVFLGDEPYTVETLKATLSGCLRQMAGS